jgi:hypothetical protein
MISTLTVDLALDEANATTYALASAIKTEAEAIDHPPVSLTAHWEMARFRERVERIGRFAAVNEQLDWRVNWDHRDEKRLEPIRAEVSVLLDVAAVLHDQADQQRRYGDDEVDGHFKFDEAARTIARAFADAEAVTA